MLPGNMLLVPGIAAHFGVNTLHTVGISSALPAIWGVAAKIGAIVCGLFVGASIVPQKAGR